MALHLTSPTSFRPTLGFEVPTYDRSARVIGVMVEYLLLADQPATVLARLVDPQIRLVTLTITGDGYATGGTRGRPSVFGAIAAALDERKHRGTAPFTVLSCDNLAESGVAARNAVVAAARERSTELVDWIERCARYGPGQLPPYFARTVRRSCSRRRTVAIVPTRLDQGAGLPAAFLASCSGREQTTRPPAAGRGRVVAVLALTDVFGDLAEHHGDVHTIETMVADLDQRGLIPTLRSHSCRP